MHSTITVMESQCDWLTVSCTQSSRESDFRWWSTRLLAREERAGNKMADFALRGYAGLRCGRVRWGLRVDGEIVQLSGDLAAQELDNAAKLSDNCSRIDVAVTLRIQPGYPGLELAHFKEHCADYNREGRKASATLVQSDDGGATFYLGKRVSDVMLRVYNKEAESQDERYRCCHRYELEIKGDRAKLTLEDLSRASDPATVCQGIVWNWATDHGLSPAWDQHSDFRLVPGLKRRSDTETKLNWLASAVRPTVDWLREFGHQARVLKALGYDDSNSGRFLNLTEVRESVAVGYGEGEGES